MSLVDITVDGVDISFDTDAELEIGDVNIDMDRIAAQMAYWGSVWASAESERIKVEAYYRQWKAQNKSAITLANPKLAEWKVQQEIQSQAEYIKMYEAQAQAVRNSTLAKSIFESHRVKANMLQSKGAMMRAELDSTNMSTPNESKPTTKSKKERKADVEKATASMKKTFKKKKGA